MSEEIRPDSPLGSASGTSDGDLARALEELLERRSAGEKPGDAGETGFGFKDHRGTGGDLYAAPGKCPDPVDWSPLLTGQAQPAEVDALLGHAAACPACAEHLRLLSADPSAEETAEIEELMPASSDWQQSLAARLAATTTKGAQPISISSKRPSKFYLWGGIGLAASLLIAATATLWWRAANTPERLLAESYTHARIFDLRMPGAGFAEVTPQEHLRGGSTGRESAPLLDARARIERQLEAAPDDAHWLQLDARADVLEEKYDPAIDILDRLLANGPVTASLLVDDAAAYYQRGATTGSENDRATALEYLRRADELAPGDPVVLFNEAVAMEDRGQVMNAVETWNRYLRFERDPRWLAEGRRRLDNLEQKLNKLKTHQGRLEQDLATPQAMRTLAIDSATLGKFDEELSSSMLPRLLDAAFPMPVDRSRGSPCEEPCQAARTLLSALAASLERNHQDPWITQLLPSDSSTPTPEFIHAARALSGAIRLDQLGDYLGAKQAGMDAVKSFAGLHNPAGAGRAQVELSYALMRLSDLPGCYREAHAVFGRDPQFAWTDTYSLTMDHQCDPTPGTGAENDRVYQRAADLAHDHGYTLLELRARNLIAAIAVDAGDSETAWRIYLPVIHDFYAADLPAIRLYNSLAGLEEVEAFTPRVRETLLLQREVLGVVKLSQAVDLIPIERSRLALGAIRAGSIPEAQEQMQLAQAELKATGKEQSLRGFLDENELLLARVYLSRRDLTAAATMLEQARIHMKGEHNSLHQRYYAAAKGELELTLGHPDAVEPLLREALLEQERMGGTPGADEIARAQQNRELYAILAGVWLAQGRSGEDVLALWERYRLRILGDPPPPCPDKHFTCQKPKLLAALKGLGGDRLLGQVVLADRLLLYTATTQGVSWTEVPFRKDDVMAAVEPLERAVSSPATPMSQVDQAAQRVGNILLSQVGAPSAGPASNELLLEPDPILGNVPWPSVETTQGPIGLHFDLEESPTLLLDRPAGRDREKATATGRPLIVGASIAADEEQTLPEVLNEARAVARFSDEPSVLLAAAANEPRVVAHLANASSIHFAGHAAQEDGATRLLLAPVEGDGLGSRREAAGGGGAERPWLDSELLRKHPPRLARLAVFSACSTGREKEGWNHGMGDIVGTLAALGVPDVVATRWQIDSASAIPMMDGFYGGLAKGQTVPQALTEARRSMVRDARYRHPYYWAAWYASGQGNAGLSQIFHPER